MSADEARETGAAQAYATLTALAPTDTPTITPIPTLTPISVSDIQKTAQADIFTTETVAARTLTAVAQKTQNAVLTEQSRAGATATYIVQLSLTPQSTDTLTATRTPTFTSTPSPTKTPRPTATRTPSPTKTPRPTATRTPRPTNTPKPTLTAVPQSAMLYDEDFESSNLSMWRIYGTSSIVEENGNKFLRVTGPNNYPQAWLELDKSDDWKDYVWEFKLRLKGEMFAAVRGTDQYYVSAISTDGWYNVALVGSVGSYKVFKEGSLSLSSIKWYTIRIEIKGWTHKLFIDDRLIVSNIDDTLTRGSIGFYLGGGNVVDIDDIRVWEFK